MKKNKLKIISLIFIILLFICFQTIVYSSFSSTMNLTGTAHSRIETNVRITDFRLASTNNATSLYEEFSKNHIITNVDFKSSSSSITYYLEITNYGSVDIGIFDITGLPSEVNYSIKNYNLHDKICDDSGKCNSFIKKTYELTLTSTSTYSGSVQLNFDFRTYHKVTYTDITNNDYPTEVIDGGNLNITFKENISCLLIRSNDIKIGYYNKVGKGQTISVNNVINDIEFKIQQPVAKLKTGTINKVGSEVCIQDECFYIISNDGTTVSLLSKYNLHAANRYDTSNGFIPLANPTGKQSSNAIGWFNGTSASNPIIGSTVFSNTNYWSGTVTSYPAYVYNNQSSLYEYIENYKRYLESLNSPIKSARVIKLEELKQLGCTYYSSLKYLCNNAPSWVYSTSYWGGDAYNANNISNIDCNANFNYLTYLHSDYGIRPVIEMDVENIYALPTITVNGNLDTSGTEICIGTECFYVISSDNNNVTLLGKYNLYIGETCSGTGTSASCSSYGKNATGLQDSTMRGYISGQSTKKGIVNFSSNAYWSSTVTSYPSNVYNEKSDLYQYLENYKSYMNDLQIEITDARVITLDELIKLGCVKTSGRYNCTNAPRWVYSTSYWTQTVNSTNTIYSLDSDGNLNPLDYTHVDYGLRPIIVIPKYVL